MISSEKLEEIYKLKNLVRYNNRARLKDETVAEHSFFVALMSLIICDTLNFDKETTYQALVKAILHDMPEIDMNDITHDVKERLNLAEIFEEYEAEYYLKNFKSFKSLMNLQDGSLSSLVVLLADAESVKQFTQNEIMLGNNSKDMIKINKECQSRIDKLERSLYSKLKENSL